MTKAQRAAFSIGVGVPAIIAFGYFTSGWAAVALFMVMFADNVGRSA